MATYLTTPLPNSLPSHKLGFQPEEGIDHQVQSIAQHWLTQFELATSANDGALFQSLFVKNGFWRDVMAFTNDYRAIRTSNIAAAANVSPVSLWRNSSLTLYITRPASLSSRPGTSSSRRPLPACLTHSTTSPSSRCTTTSKPKLDPATVSLTCHTRSTNGRLSLASLCWKGFTSTLNVSAPTDLEARTMTRCLTMRSDRGRTNLRIRIPKC
jgi:hypothetical protein